ncbi:MAG: transcriptional regulator [Coxiella sp. (in: Bacteria)]|nr:MAG: transcriptional regulator [Coxiella sp. (in: g-proteobacteria)]
MPTKTAKELAQEIAKRLTAMRLQRAWTREDLAKRSGINIYTLKHFERTGQISLERLIAICEQLEILNEFERTFKPRARISIDDWQIPQQQQHIRKRGRRKMKSQLQDEPATEPVE